MRAHVGNTRKRPAGPWTTVRVLAFAALAVTILSGGDAPSTLCIGADGHVTIESAVDGRCARPLAAAETKRVDTAAHAAASSCCGSCTDLGLGLTSYRSGESAKKPSAPAGSPAVLAAPLATLLQRESTASYLRAPHAPALRSSVPDRSSVLRC